ncbi:carbohydrate ABC transporter permease [Roseateles toxinivorans]|uniref:Carbohydrate ABC transporter membrane protein 2 (CUT1 family) n=1 Tax=Roseateles toxinivorans TaxID=270368 RepID=A0A4R6QS92_9BURK|nr:carbohydrate ABC transporter permease [Roseateles toxinivorans]TDP74500.1 carbohydrate ABC transporter membrane protein 2 (CUT1 family) [Roseateles toxinivorans]
MSEALFARLPFWARTSLWLGVGLMCIWSLFPIYWMVVSSLRTPQDLFLPPDLIPKRIDWKFENYTTLLELTDYAQQFKNSVVVALAVVVITLLLSIVIAYTVTRYRVPGKSIIVGSMLYAYMFPPLLLAIPMLSIFARMGLADNLLAVVLAHCTLTLPLGVWLFWGFFKGMPFDLEEAAMVDGCTRLGAFIRVVLPLSLPGIVTVAIFAFLLSWTDYVFSFVLVSSDSNKTLPVGLASILGTFDARWGELMAGATLIAAPLFVIFAFLSRYFIQGLAAGAVKG